MNYFILFVVPLTISIISPHFLIKRFVCGKENTNTITEMEAINRRVSHFMSTFSTPINNYSINIEVKDGKVTKVVTGTELTEKVLQNDEQITVQKAFSQRALKIGLAIYMFLLSFIICFFILLPIAK